MEPENNQANSGPNWEVHTMPKKFVSSQANGQKAKVTGLVIIISVLVVALAGAGFYLSTVLRKPANQPAANQSVNLAVKTNQNKNNNQNKANNNSNSNKNVNANSQVNTNTNDNGNSNSNVNEDNLPPTETLPDTTDTDNDGLTDEEEKLYGSLANNADTDGDGYLDGGEVMSLYNPAGSNKLADSGRLDTFANAAYDYSLIYPIDWTLEAVNAASQEIRVISKTGEFIQIFMADNPEAQSVTGWYLDQWPGLRSGQVRKISGDKLNGVWSLDGLTAYLGSQDKIYIINYGVGNKEEVNFMTTFEMMVKSFKLVS
ncbi:MAG: hypothetical protein V1692_02135 [bacterium]